MDGNAMMARWLCTVVVFSAILSSGCCCFNNGACGPRESCCLCLPCFKCPPRWNGCCNDCGPSPCESCSDYCNGCGDCGLLSHVGFFGIRGCLTCKRGCGEIYYDEWCSDPPDCCDPCDKCHGVYTGQSGYCCLGPFQRMLAALHGYKYCPPPNCGPWRPIFGHCKHGGRACGCGEVGCASCAGGSAHGADIYYEGPVLPRSQPARGGVPTPAPDVTTTMIEEGWETPRSVPQSGRPVRHVPQPPPGQLSGRYPQQQPAKVAAKPTAQSRPTIGAGVRQANYHP